jgi:hypothetical protein
MIHLPASASVFVMHEPISFRNGIDGTNGIIRNILKMEPMSGSFFVFKNRQGHCLRILFYDSQGFWIMTKRLSKGTFNSVWPKGNGLDNPYSDLLARELQVLIWGGDPQNCHFPDLWRKVA